MMPAAKPGRRTSRRCRNGLPCRRPRSSWMTGASTTVLARGPENGASRFLRRREPEQDRLIRRSRSGVTDGLPAGIDGSGATPGMRGEGVQARSPLCRTEPSARGVVPLHGLSGCCCHDRPCGGAARPCRAGGYAGPAGVHHRSAKVCIDPPCLFHTSGPARGIRPPSRIEPPQAEPSSTCQRVPSAPVPHACAGSPQGRWRASRRPASRRIRRGWGHPLR